MLLMLISLVYRIKLIYSELFESDPDTVKTTGPRKKLTDVPNAIELL